jgi:hypothetical protein
VISLPELALAAITTAFDDMVRKAKARVQEEAMEGEETSNFEVSEVSAAGSVHLEGNTYSQERAAVERRLTSDVGITEILPAIEFNCAQLSNVLDSTCPVLQDLMEEHERVEVQSHALDHRKRDADNLNSQKVTSPRKQRKCSESLADTVYKTCQDSVADSMKIEMKPLLPSGTFPIVYSNDLFNGSEGLLDVRSRMQEEVKEWTYIGTDQISMVQNELATCKVECKDKPTCEA